MWKIIGEDEIYLEDWRDAFDGRVKTTRFTMRRITVDGIPGAKSTLYSGDMISIRSTDSDASNPYVYRDDGYEMDEEAWLKYGIIRSTNPKLADHYGW